MHSENGIEIPNQLIEKFCQGNSIVALTGAGISAESGIPTFREPQTRLWVKYNPEDLASPKGFHSNPKLVWDWYLWRRNLILDSKSNAGHIALAKIEDLLTEENRKWTLITQNVDGYHQLAGSRNIIELHGNIFGEKCSICGIQSDSSFHSGFTQVIPRCKHCHGLLRPDVVWFGESLPQNAIQEAYNVTKNCDLFFCIGTSAAVEPAASLPILAKQNKSVVAEININRTSLTSIADFVLLGSSSQVLAMLFNQINQLIT
jgi:NAD-dependent deacetylase